MKTWQEYCTLTRRQYFADFFITPPITITLAIVSVFNSWSLLWPAKFAAGAVAWTLYEYAIHRWIFHVVPFVRDLHDMHHEDQRAYIAVPPIVTLAIYAVFWLAFGFDQGAFAAGFACAYVVYSCIHTAHHYATIQRGHWLYSLKRHHALHHMFDDENFGVTTKIWDWLFGTLRT